MKTSIISIGADGERRTVCTFSTKKEAEAALKKIRVNEQQKKELAEEFQKRNVTLEEYTYCIEKAKDEDVPWQERLLTNNTNGNSPIWALVFLLALGNINGIGNQTNN